MFRSTLAVLVFCLAPAQAATWTVTLNTDSQATATSPGDGPGSNGDLRYAILNAASGDTIQFSCGSPCTVALHGPLPPITKNLTLDGGTLGNVILNGSGFRAFFVDNSVVSISHLQIQNARAAGGFGGAGGGGGGAGLGGGIFVVGNAAHVTLTSVYFLNNSAIGGPGGIGSVNGTGGGGGLGGNGGSGAAGGGGGVLGMGSPSAGGEAGGGGGDAGPTGPEGAGSSGYAGNVAGAAAIDGKAGAGGFGGGGGGSAQRVGGAGGFGGGGGGGLYPGKGDLYYLGSFHGGNGGASNVGGITGGGGGGSAAGPAIFILQGSLTTVDSSASGCAAFAGLGGAGVASGGAGLNGTADSTSVFSFLGTVNGLRVDGPVPGALVGPLSFSAPGQVTAGSQFSFNITALTNATGPAATDTSYNGTVSFTSNDPRASLPPQTTFAGGLSGSLLATLKTAGTQTITAIDTGNPNISGTSASITVTPAAAGIATANSGSGQAAKVGTAFVAPLMVTITDAYHNLIANQLVTFAGPGSGASIVATSGTTNSSGQVSVSVTANNVAGAYQVTATAGGASTTFSLTNIAASQSISFTGLPATATYGSAGPYTLNGTASSGLALSYGVKGPATLNGAALTITGTGTVVVTASQAGNAFYAAATPVTQTIVVGAPPPGFTIRPIPGSETVFAGVPMGGYLLELQPVNGFSGNVSLTCSGGPNSSVCVDFPQTVKVNGTAMALTGILFPPRTKPGTYTITFTGVSGARTSTATAQFTVK